MFVTYSSLFAAACALLFAWSCCCWLAFATWFLAGEMHSTAPRRWMNRFMICSIITGSGMIVSGGVGWLGSAFLTAAMGGPR